ncbi:MAG TPA: hypothetical protein VEP49_22860 [Acidimicrobiia bacterium]|nr:hypothetical protein [Acidimicrobiia bacterium]
MSVLHRSTRVSAVVAGTHDEWQVTEHRYLSEGSMNKLYDPPEPAVLLDELPAAKIASSHNRPAALSITRTTSSYTTPRARPMVAAEVPAIFAQLAPEIAVATSPRWRRRFGRDAELVSSRYLRLGRLRFTNHLRT